MFGAAITLSVIGLFIGPMLAAWGRGSHLASAAVDGATLGVVPALLLLRVLPHLVEEVGAWAVGAMGLGYLVFLALESRSHRRSTDIGLVIILPALAIHGFLDGAGLALAFRQNDMVGTSGPMLAGALLAHRLPEGLFVASVFLPAVGPRRTAVRLVVLACAVILGALSGRELLDHAPDRVLHVVVAVGLGVMLRMVVHRHGVAPASRREQVLSGTMFVLCLGGLILSPDPRALWSRSQPGELGAWQALLPLLLQTAPMLLLATAIGEAVSLASKGKPRTLRHSMWLPAILVSLPLLGPLFTFTRALVEPLFGHLGREHGAEEEGEPSRQHLGLEFLAALAPRASRVLPSYCVGILLAVAIEASLPRDMLHDIGWTAYVALVPLAAIVRIGAAGVSLLVVMLVHKGVPASAALMFTGLAAYFETAPKWRWSWRTGAALSLLCLVTLGTGPLLQSAGFPRLHELARRPHGWAAWMTVGAIGVLALGQLAAWGPRAWFASLRPPVPDPAIPSDEAMAANATSA